MNRTVVEDILRRARESHRVALTVTEAAAICRAYDIPMPEDAAAADAASAVAAADRIGYPVALKVISAGIGHKSEAGGVRLNVKSADLS